jgi:hypothetical protein
MSEPLSTVPPVSGENRAEPTGAPEEPNGLPPRLNAAQRAARRQAQLELSQAHPDRYVVYIDIWTGDSLERRPLVVAETLGECHRLMDALPIDVRERAVVTRIPPADSFFIPTAEFS